MAEIQKTFTLFPQLPPKIRLMIYSFALPTPRLKDRDEETEPITICHHEHYKLPECACTAPQTRRRGRDCHTDVHEDYDPDHVAPLHRGDFTFPGLLVVNQEARQFVLKHCQVFMNRC